ncbi:hypothetical protein [Pelagicoccus mobilis]|uniref:DUF1353 domain-containing protein n=1 Tax=Pelagicoccus mobilis TaxID=415221 RepID=A0A934RZ94_9BACT|nr:hypothetical protein [Pelagicoccus mobilis]MBK1876564.1 hypothetical protein [Pelagicoccus mobilis]
MRLRLSQLARYSLLLALALPLAKADSENAPDSESKGFKRCFEIYTQPKYQIGEPYIHQLSFDSQHELEFEHIHLSGDQLTLQSGFSWDGASGPGIDTPKVLRGTAIHDALYNLIRAGQLDIDPFKAHADSEFIKILEEDGVSKQERAIIEESVSRFGLSSTAAPDKGFTKFRIRARRSIQSFGLLMRSAVRRKPPEEIVNRPRIMNFSSPAKTASPTAAE